MSARRSLCCGVVGLCAILAGATALSEKPHARLSLAAPSLDSWSPEFNDGAGSDEDVDHVAVITGLEVTLVESPGGRAIGSAWLGNRLPATRTDHSCSGGHYLEVSGGAYVCSSDARLEPADRRKPLEATSRIRRPRLQRPTPYSYVKVTRRYSPRFDRLPTAKELAKVPDAREARRWLDVLERWMNGTYLVAVAGSVEVGGQRLLRTVGGRFITRADADDKPEIEMHGERLTGDVELPLAFTTRSTGLLCVDGDSAQPCGRADKHARFPVSGQKTIGGRDLVLGEPPLAAPADAVRVVRTAERPDQIGEDDKWIHVDLTEQSLVAYKGDEPVYATLVSSGTREHPTLPGVFQIERLYVTKTMRGRDADGLYEVQEIPWTMYYDGNFALHGAYWHNTFGNPRSHGCINVPPADARWLFYWSDPDLPRGWHSRLHVTGTHVVVTGKTPPTPEESDG